MPTRKTKTRPISSPKAKLNVDQSRAKLGALSPWIVAAVLALSIGFVYDRSRHAPFIFDDELAINKNSSIMTLWPLIGADHPGPLNPPPNLPTSGRPLVNLSFAINYRIGGLKPVGYHVVNVMLHFLSAMLAWAVVRRTLRLPYFAGR